MKMLRRPKLHLFSLLACLLPMLVIAFGQTSHATGPAGEANQLLAQSRPSGGSQVAAPPRSSGSAPAKPAKPKAPAKSVPPSSPGQAGASAPAASQSPTSTWSLVVGTYTGSDHLESAHRMIANLRLVAPQVTGLRVHTTAKGSMVVYGNYADRDDPNAAADTEYLKAITYQGRQVFTRVMLTRLDLRLALAQLHPFDLLSARRTHPKVDPLYTIDVAIWMTNDDPKARDRITYDEVKRRAEAFASELRAKKEQAYFYHDDKNQWSTVTVGLFDRRAIDSRSGLFSPDVTNVMKRYPARLVNGEPLIELKDPRDPKKGGTPQKPKLVLVPTM